MELENILSDFSHVCKDKVQLFSLTDGLKIQHKYRQTYMYLEIHTKHASKTETVRGEQRRMKGRKER
jgi:hypothetical protein